MKTFGRRVIDIALESGASAFIITDGMHRERVRSIVCCVLTNTEFRFGQNSHHESIFSPICGYAVWICCCMFTGSLSAVCCMCAAAPQLTGILHRKHVALCLLWRNMCCLCAWSWLAVRPDLCGAVVHIYRRVFVITPLLRLCLGISSLQPHASETGMLNT